MIDSALRLAASAVESLGTRLELGAVELEEARLRWAQRALAVACALFLLGHGLVIALLALAWWAGPEHAASVLAVSAAILLGAGALAVWQWRRLSRAQPPLLDATLAQLRADVRALTGQAGPAP